MLVIQKALPLVPPRLLAAVVKVVGIKRLIDWFFARCLAIAPPALCRRHSSSGRRSSRLPGRRISIRWRYRALGVRGRPPATMTSDISPR